MQAGAQRSPRNGLRDLMSMVRAGLPKGTVHDLWKSIETLIDRLRKEVSYDRDGLHHEVDQLQLATLEAEYLYQSGKAYKAVQVLKPWYLKLYGELKDGSIAKPAVFRGRIDKRLLRQKLWALMYYVGYHFSALQRRHSEAIKQLELIEKVIRKNLGTAERDSDSPQYHPAGTLAVCHFFLGQAYRGQREFRQAEWHFVRSQEETQKRLEKKLNAPAVRNDPRLKEYETAYHHGFTARILGSGMSWVALQEGRLTRAEYLLRTAQALLTDTRLESLKQFVNSMLQITVRRRTPVGSDDYLPAVQAVEECFHDFKRSNDITGQTRCATELVRAYLDLVEFAREDLTENKSEDLAAAKRWLDRLYTLATAGQDSDMAGIIRHGLLKTRFELLNNEREKALEAVDEVEANYNSARRDDKESAEFSEFFVEIELWRAAIHLTHEQTKDLQRARDILQELFKPDRQDRLHDPVLQAECYLRMMEATPYPIDQKKYRIQWIELKQFVENAYLHHRWKVIQENRVPQPFHKEIDIELSHEKTVRAYKQEFEQWIDELAFSRYPYESDEDLARVFDSHKTTVYRKRQKYKLKSRVEKTGPHSAGP